MEDSRRATVVDALSLWDLFPLEARPRPIVLAGPVVISSAGFNSSEAAISGIEVLLDRPLGNRVLVDHLGNPMPVTAEVGPLT